MRIRIVPLYIIFILSFIPAIEHILAAELMIIANKSVPEDTVKKEDLKDIFTNRKTRWSDDSKIRIIENREEGANNLFMGKYVHKTPRQFMLYWRNELFKGMGAIPPYADTSKGIIDIVKETDGAISYISIDKAAETPDVKIIQVK